MRCSRTRSWTALAEVKLVGVKPNRSALGARIEAERKQPDGTTVWVVRVVGNNGSFGGNPLVQHIGLGDATSVTRLVVTWPTSQTTQTFTGLAADLSIVITEGSYQYYPGKEVPHAAAY
ncbi:MAG: ASPIC/UnbV domain-containing protein [Isosphaeraceae bacterium]